MSLPATVLGKYYEEWQPAEGRRSKRGRATAPVNVRSLVLTTDPCNHNDDGWRIIIFLQVFDVTDQTIESVQLDDDVGTHLHYIVDREVINFGKKLSIFIPPLKDDQSERYVHIFFLYFISLSLWSLIFVILELIWYILHAITNMSCTRWSISVYHTTSLFFTLLNLPKDCVTCLNKNYFSFVKCRKNIIFSAPPLSHWDVDFPHLQFWLQAKAWVCS